MDITEKKETEEFIFKKEPRINVVSKEEFDSRVEKIFYLLWKTLSKSFGPYGAPTLICNYPASHATKDGFTIMKNLSMDASESKIDQAIADMASDICGRLNYTVGDGTTTAIIATNSIYQSYLSKKDEFKNKYILPRDIMKIFELLKRQIIQKLHSVIIPLHVEENDILAEEIRKVVYISSNGDEEITNFITDIYKEIGVPSVTCALAPDGITKKKIINGYIFDNALNDRLYLNSDNKTMELINADVIIFGVKITESIYLNILKPLNAECKQRGRNLIVCAPLYDEMAMKNLIINEINNEYRKTHKVNMVLTTYRMISEHRRRLCDDFAMLMNTQIIDRATEISIQEKLASGKTVSQVFQIDERDIPGLKCIAISDNANESGQQIVSYLKGVDDLEKTGYSPISKYFPLDDDSIPLGFVPKCSLGLEFSHYTELLYDEDRYKKHLEEAKDTLEKSENKYKKLGTFNVEVGQNQKRFYSLGMKMGLIEVGGDTELAQKMVKDFVDDAIRAAASAYTYGVVNGCNVTLLSIIKDLRNQEDNTEVVNSLLDILYNGFFSVYKTILQNAFEDISLSRTAIKKIPERLLEITNQFGIGKDIFEDKEILSKTVDELQKQKKEITFHNILIEYSILIDQVFDVSTFSYSKDVINSAQTDEEILKATIDLISLLIIGNQMVITAKNNFE